MKVENCAEGDEGGAESQGGRVSMFALLCLTRTSQNRRRVVVEPGMGQHKGTRGQAQASEDRRERTAQRCKKIRTGVSICFLLTCFLLMESDREMSGMGSDPAAEDRCSFGRNSGGTGVAAD